ncbi:hypothetical protein [Fulvivirga lutea]|uniref:Porin n=1 Tax=Fulvivirga lutea TaxID=2810512 RepID=A0A974ZZM9_9BACT|nr:hypothetical protein [Fulvivirga lutea]QSE96310.1 hypothetical protein JR347_11895 [Fulvivirga lutea]
MKNSIKATLLVGLLGIATIGTAQVNRALQYDRLPGQAGVNVYETSKEDTIGYDGFKVRVGGDFAMQFQSITQGNDAGNLAKLGQDFNLPTANLNIDVQLEDGVKMHLRTYLSSRHHEEAWVKGGHIQIDKMDFVKPGFMSGFMEIATIRIGLDEFNYGDAHFRRTDNARAIYNPFVANYIMDAFSTEAFGELTLQKNGMLAVLGVTNGKLNQNVVVNDNSDNKPSFFGKLGIDKQLDDDKRVRLTGSWYLNKGTTTGTWLYGGDRAGARYYGVLHTQQEVADRAVSDFEPRLNARFTEVTAIQINPFVQLGGLEFFGIYEVASGSADGNDGSFTQIAAEALYRFGGNDQFYAGGRYNTVKGARVDGAPDQEISRINLGGGWFMTNNVIVKLEYVSQKYDGDGFTGTKYQGASFEGVNIEAAISF